MLVVTATRIAFPWDILIWAESPFMTNMLKLQQGQSLFLPPEQVNSFVYTPGLEYITYMLLSPFGLETDVRFCRAVSVFIGLSAALTIAIAVQRLATIASAESPEQRIKPAALLTACFFLFTLIIFGNFTADIPHPDNLYILHFSLCFLLTLKALESGSLKQALFAVMIASTGLWAKQLAGGAAVGVVIALLAGFQDRQQRIVITGVAATTLLVSLVAVLLPAQMRFYVVELLSKHTVEWEKLYDLIIFDILQTPHRVLLYAGAAWALIKVWWPNISLRPYLILWAALGVTEVLPSFSAYIKTFGLWNNLIIIDLWLSILLAPVLAKILFLKAPSATPSQTPAAFIHRHGWLIYGALLTLSLMPGKMTPDSEYHRYGMAVQTAVDEDVQAGRSILVDHGAMYMINAGATDVPLDRANSMLELRAGKQTQLAGINQRVAGHYYDRIYLASTWYGDETTAVIKDNYRVLFEIPRAKKPYGRARGLRGGFQGELTAPVLVMVPDSGASP